MGEQRSALPRPIWRTLYERDIDLVVLSLLHTSGEFRRRLIETVAPERIRADTLEFEGAWHSVIDGNGHESDLEALWRSPEGEAFVVLIEDKLSASFQPDQALRYVERAKAYVADGRADLARTLLIAPSGFLGGHQDARLFDGHLSLEEIGEWCGKSLPGSLGPYLQGKIDFALRGARRSGNGASGERTRQFPEIYEVLREELLDSSPALWISNSSENEWVYLQARQRAKGVMIRYRFLEQCAEVSFPLKWHDEDHIRATFASHPIRGASLIYRGEELAAWIATPELDVGAEAETQRSMIRSAVATLEILQAWQETHFGP